MIANFFRVIVGLTGLLLLYVGLFLTETEEGGITESSRGIVGSG